MTFRNALWFSYANIKSSDMGLINININSDMLEEPLVSERIIHEVKIKGNSKPYFQTIEYEPLQFNVSFAFEESWDSKKLREITRWLCSQEYYQPLFFSSDINKIFYALVVESPTLIHNSLSEGYINLTFKCKDNFSYSPIYESKIFDFITNPSIFSDNLSSGTLDNVETI